MTYGWHTGTYEWHKDDVRGHVSDIRIFFKTKLKYTIRWYWTYGYVYILLEQWQTDDMRVLNTSDTRMTYEWHTNDMPVHRSDITYFIRMSLACTRMSSVCHLYVLVCHSYVLVCHPYVTGIYSYVIRMSLECSFTMNCRPEVFCKKGFFFNKVAGLESATLLKRRLWPRCFPVNFVKFLRTPISIEYF